MKVANAIKAVEKATGKTPKFEGNHYVVEMNNKVLSFRAQYDEVSYVHIRSIEDVSDPMRDYHAGTFLNNMKHGISSLLEA